MHRETKIPQLLGFTQSCTRSVVGDYPWLAQAHVARVENFGFDHDRRLKIQVVDVIPGVFNDLEGLLEATFDLDICKCTFEWDILGLQWTVVFGHRTVHCLLRNLCDVTPNYSDPDRVSQRLLKYAARGFGIQFPSGVQKITTVDQFIWYYTNLRGVANADRLSESAARYLAKLEEKIEEDDILRSDLRRHKHHNDMMRVDPF